MICCVSCVRVKNSFVWSFGHLVNGMVGVEANGIISSVIFEVATVSSQARNVIFNHIGDCLASFSLGFLSVSFFGFLVNSSTTLPECFCF